MIRDPGSGKPAGIITSQYQGQGPIGSSGTFQDQRLVQTPKGGVLLILPSSTIHTWTLTLNNGTMLILNGITSPFVQAPFALDSKIFESIQIDVADSNCQYISLPEGAEVPFISTKPLSAGSAVVGEASVGFTVPEAYGEIGTYISNPAGSGVVLIIESFTGNFGNEFSSPATTSMDLYVQQITGQLVLIGSLVNVSVPAGGHFYFAVVPYTSATNNSQGSQTNLLLLQEIRLLPGESIVAYGVTNQEFVGLGLFFDYQIDHL